MISQQLPPKACMMMELMQPEGQVVLQLSRRSCSCVTICHLSWKYSWRGRKGWNLHPDCILSVPGVLFVLQKYCSAPARQNCGWPELMDVCEDGHMVVSDGWLTICTQMNDRGSSWSYFPDGSSRGSAFLCLVAHDPVRGWMGRVWKEGKTEDIRHRHFSRASLTTSLKMCLGLESYLCFTSYRDLHLDQEDGLGVNFRWQ